MEEVVIPPQLFKNQYKNKRVLVTGHTGFKGSWLSLWLVHLGAQVAGFSKYLPTQPCLFEALSLKKKLKDHRKDICAIRDLEKAFAQFKPEIVFHLAAQPIVRHSYDEPKITFDTNLGGTVNVLECVKNSPTVKAVVIITSDKCYENVGWNQGYKETDRLGGADPYSASKACAELAFSAYCRSFFNKGEGIKCASARAGNVIGGGDWAKDRIIPDCMRSWSQNQKALIRKPEATRPWQHVLEPISGYLWLGASLLTNPDGVAGESFNFGPRVQDVHSVSELVELSATFMEQKGRWEHAALEGERKEATLLQLSIDKADQRLSWRPALTFKETVQLTAAWYKVYYQKKEDMAQFSMGQIQQYIQKAQEQNIKWSQLKNHP